VLLSASRGARPRAEGRRRHAVVFCDDGSSDVDFLLGAKDLPLYYTILLSFTRTSSNRFPMCVLCPSLAVGG
jgi:hypothetical protein